MICGQTIHKQREPVEKVDSCGAISSAADTSKTTTMFHKLAAMRWNLPRIDL